MAVPAKPNDAAATAPSPSPDAADTATVEAASSTGFVVAPGRSVDGRQHPDTVELDEADAKRFLELGFVLDGNGERVVRSEGPAVIQGAEIKER